MAFGIIHFFPDGTKEQYDKSIKAVHPPGGLPEGQLFHAAGASPGGWSIIAVHDSKDSWVRFRDDVLLPKMKKGIEGGLQGMPQETELEDVEVAQR